MLVVDSGLYTYLHTHTQNMFMDFIVNDLSKM